MVQYGFFPSPVDTVYPLLRIWHGGFSPFTRPCINKNPISFHNECIAKPEQIISKRTRHTAFKTNAKHDPILAKINYFIGSNYYAFLIWDTTIENTHNG